MCVVIAKWKDGRKAKIKTRKEVKHLDRKPNEGDDGATNYKEDNLDLRGEKGGKA